MMNEMTCWIAMAAALMLGWIAGLTVSTIRNRRRTVGVLREDLSDPDSPYLFLELPPLGYERIQSSKYIVLKVVRENYISAANTTAGMENTPHNGKEK